MVCLDRCYNHNLLMSRFDVTSLKLRRILLSNKIDYTPLLAYINMRVPNFHSKPNGIFYLSVASTNILKKPLVYTVFDNFNIFSDQGVYKSVLYFFIFK